MTNKIAILVPCFNEEDTISEVGSDLRKSNYPYLIINDGSTDRTSKLLDINNLNHIDYYPNRGKGNAIKFGAGILIGQGFNYILIMDADGQHDIKDIYTFINYLETRSMVKIIIGNRFWNPKRMSLIRKLTNKVMSWVVSRLAEVIIPDTQCGFRLIHKDIINKLITESDNFDYESEQLIKAGREGYEIISIPITCIYKKGRESKMNPLRDTIRFFKMIKRFI